MSKTVMKPSERQRAKTWLIRFIKFNLIGLVVFLTGSAVFGLLFSYFGIWTWLIANGIGSVLQFSLISYFNKKRGGVIFEQCQPAKEGTSP